MSSGPRTCRASRCSTARRRCSRCRASRPPSAAASTSGSSARTSCRSPSAATSCATSSSSSARRWPKAPTRSSPAGRRWSNHCRLTAAAGARAGLGVHLVLGGPPRRRGRARTSVSTSSWARTVHVARPADRAERDALVEQVGARGPRGRSAAIRHRRRWVGVDRGRRPGPRRARARGQVGRGIGPRTSSCSRRRPAGPRPGLLAGLRLAGRRDPGRRHRGRPPGGELRPTIVAALDGLAPLVGRRRVRRADRARRRRSSAPATDAPNAAADEATRLLAGPRASSSIRSTRPRPSPGSSRASAPAPRRPTRRLLARRRHARPVRGPRRVARSGGAARGGLSATRARRPAAASGPSSGARRPSRSARRRRTARR